MRHCRSTFRRIPKASRCTGCCGSLSAEEATTRITGLNPGEPLYDDVRDVMAGAVEPRYND